MLRRRAALLILAALVASAASAQDIRIVVDADGVNASFSGAMDGAPSGDFVGKLSLNHSKSEINVKGTAQASLQRVRISVKLNYKDVPEDWLNRYRSYDFDYRLHGQIAGARNVDWAGTRRYDEVEAETKDNGGADFLRLSSIALTQAASNQISARVQVAIQNPLSFPLKMTSANYRLTAKGKEIGSGSIKNATLRPAQNTLDLPMDLDQAALLSAVGAALRSGGNAVGHLHGTLVIGLPGGDIEVPLDLTGKVSLTKGTSP
jgi:LEA14-like dessication related protein